MYIYCLLNSKYSTQTKYKKLRKSKVNISSQIKVSQEVITPLFKVVGIGYITEFSADIADESGNKSISSKIIFGGKIAICMVALPIILKMLDAILSLL